MAYRVARMDPARMTNYLLGTTTHASHSATHGDTTTNYKLVQQIAMHGHGDIWQHRKQDHGVLGTTDRASHSATGGDTTANYILGRQIAMHGHIYVWTCGRTESRTAGYGIRDESGHLLSHLLVHVHT